MKRPKVYRRVNELWDGRREIDWRANEIVVVRYLVGQA
jgi:hypothetical protein